MLCEKCRRDIADDSLYCAYCGAEQTADQAYQAPEPDFEPYVPSLGRRIFGWIVTAILLACLIAFVYLLSSTGTTLSFGPITPLE